jgi:TonB-linked SusC/RagA family outer membrane protein
MSKNYLKKYALLFAMLSMSFMAFAQNGGVTGKVIDETNQPLPGASVSIDGTTLGATTDANGVFTIRDVKPGTYTLSAKFIGYVVNKKSVTITAGQSASISFALTPSSQSLNEVVVIGYGTQSKREVTGAITTVTAKDFQSGTITNPADLIQGKVAGVSINNTGGEPGGTTEIRIRGGASLNANNEPLIVIDGVPLEPHISGTSSTIAGVADPMSMINPADIESMTVLKDAASTAIYGSRASNGVIIITTKKGTTGAPKINFTTNTSASTPEKELSVLSAAQVRSYVNSYDAANPTGNDYASTLGTANTNWQKEIYQTAIATDNNLSVSGAYKWLPYRVSVGYLDQNGILKTDDIKRTTASLRLNPSFFKNALKIDVNLNGSYQESRFANQSAIGGALSFDPTQPVYEKGSPFGGYYETVDAVGSTTPDPNAPRNPVADLYQQNNDGQAYRSFGNIDASYKFPFLPALTANANWGYDVSKGQGNTFIPAYAAQDIANLGDNTNYLQRNINVTAEYYLNYTKNFQDIKSSINAQAGYGYYNFLSTTYNYETLSADGKPAPGAVAPVFPTSPGEYTIISYYGRLIYTYDSKYTLQGSIRTDGSSKFAPSDRWGVFPAGGFSWNINDEDFLKNNNVLSDLKLRVTYGVTGQQDGIAYYSYEPTYQLTSNNNEYPIGSNYVNGYTPQAYFSNLKWETTNTFNAGFDFGFLNQRIYGSIDYYNRETKNLLSEVPIPAGSNFTNEGTINVGKVKSNGLELNLNFVPVKTKDFTWTFNYNFAFQASRVTSLFLVGNANATGVATGTISGGTGNAVQYNQVGYSPNEFYVYQQVYGANGKPLEGVYVDRDHSGSLDAGDQYYDHSPLPPYVMGFSTQFNYKKWVLSTVLRAEIGNYLYNNVAASEATQGALINNTGIVDNALTSIYQTGFKEYNYNSDYWVQNASFVRMDNLRLGYNFGQIFHDKHINLSVSANCQNVFVITKYQGLDPEVPSGIDNNTYPRPRTYTLGVNLGL